VTDTNQLEPKGQPEDVTPAFNHYRVSARAIWNTAFWPDPDFRNWDSVDQFNAIQRLLFAELVLAKLGKEWPLEGVFRHAIPFFHIVPSSSEVPIMIQNPRPEGTGYWDHAVKSIKRGQAELLFKSYFDWDSMDYLDLRYYCAQIASLDGHSELVGREALIDCKNSVVHLTGE
jgi:hypothetical protein